MRSGQICASINPGESLGLLETDSTRDPGAAGFHMYLLGRIVDYIYQGPAKKTGKNAACFSSGVNVKS